MEHYENLYFIYFSMVLKNGGIALDITPSYAGLSAHRFNFINTKFIERGVQVKCIFIMRDPVKRCISAFNMNRNKSQDGRAHEGIRFDIAPQEAFKEFFSRKTVECEQIMCQPLKQRAAPLNQNR